LQTLKARTLKTKSHLQTKIVFWFLFAGSRGGTNRIRIMSVLRNRPRNRNQLATELDLDYKNIQHHIKILEKNNLVTKVGSNYGVTYFPSVLFEDGEVVFDEIVSKLKEVGINLGKTWKFI